MRERASTLIVIEAPPPRPTLEPAARNYASTTARIFRFFNDHSRSFCNQTTQKVSLSLFTLPSNGAIDRTSEQADWEMNKGIGTFIIEAPNSRLFGAKNR
jgi:hypothetical protein